MKSLEAEAGPEGRKPHSFDFETLGKAYFHLNRWHEALDALQKAVELNPHSPALHFFLASTFSRLKRYKEALVECRRLAEMEPRDGYVLFVLASTYKQLGREEEAVEQFERAAPLLPNGAFADLMMRGAYATMKDPQRAVEKLKKIVELRASPTDSAPPVAEPEMLSAYCLAAGAYEHEIRSQKDPESYFRLGLIYGFVQQYAKAATALEQATELRRDYFDAYLLLGYTYGVNGLKQYDKSIEAYRRGLTLKPESAECLYGIGSGYRWLGEHDKAVEALGKAVRVAQTDDSLLISVGCEYEALKEYEKALEVFEKAVAFKPDNCVAWASLGRAYSSLKQDQEAVEAFQKAIDLRPDYYWAHDGLGWAYSNLRRFNEAAAEFETTIRIQPNKADAYGHLGVIYNNLNQFDKSIPTFKRGISLRPDDVDIYCGLALAYLSLGQHEKSIEVYESALAIKPDCTECLSGLGNSYCYLGDYEKATHAYEAGLDLCRKNSDTLCEARALIGMGNMNLLTRQDVAAEHNLIRALAVFHGANMKYEEAVTLEKIAGLYADLGNHEDTLRYLEKAFSLYRELNRPEDIVNIYTHMAVSSLDSSERIRYAKLAIDFADQHGLGSHRNALRSYEMLLDIFHLASVDDQTRMFYARKFQVVVEGGHETLHPALASLVYGISLCITGQDLLAKVQFENTLRVASETKQRSLEVMALEMLVVLDAKLQDFENAKKYCLAAVDRIEYLRKSSQSLNGRMEEVEYFQPVYAAAVFWSVRLRDAETAFNYMEKARGNELLDAVGDKVGVKATDLDLVKRERFLRLRAFSIEQEINELNAIKGAEDKGKLALLETEQRKVQEEHALLLEKMEKENPELFSFFAPSAVTLKETQSILDPDTTLLEYFIAGQQVFLWVVDRSSSKLIELSTSAADLGAKIEAYRERLKVLRPDYEKDAKELFDLLIRPAKPLIKTKRIGIIPYAKLHYLPFQALLDAEEDRGKTEKHFLIEEYDIFYAPSASALKYTYEKRKALNGTILAFGNPDLGDRSMDLPYAERELTEIKKAFPNATLYLGKNATKTVATKVSSGFNVVHFASHAELDAKNPLSSSIRMARSDSDDGRLTVGEIFGLDLKDTSLVTLSACETGLGELKGGDELIGLTRAFIYAGAPSIVASLWPVNDESTSRFMALFYTNLKSLPKVEALRLAQIEMIRGETGRGIVRGVGGITTQSKTSKPSREASRTVNGSHPFFWAPFILLGDWK